MHRTSAPTTTVGTPKYETSPTPCRRYDALIQYFGANGNAPAAQTRRLAAHGMTYFYNPSDPSEDRCDQPAHGMFRVASSSVAL